jgi:hypothetical protein
MQRNFELCLQQNCASCVHGFLRRSAQASTGQTGVTPTWDLWQLRNGDVHRDEWTLTMHTLAYTFERSQQTKRIN